MPTTKETYTIEQFLSDVAPNHIPFVMEIDAFLTSRGFKTKVELAKSGYVVSYRHPKTKKVLLNYLFRKSGMLVRIYGDHVAEYLDFLQTLPAGMAAAVAKEPNCKRLLDPAACNSRCPMGYVFSIRGEQHQKCRYSAFMFAVNDETMPFLRGLIEKEAAARDAA